MRRSWTPLLLTLLCAAPALGLTPRLVKDINTLPSPEGSEPDFMVRSGNLTYFVANDGENGQELWRTDGTEAGTFQVVDACPGECSSGSFPVAVPGDLFFFVAFDGSDQSLWVTKGTPATTFRLTDGVEAQAFGRRVFWIAGVLYFAANDGVHGSELWRTDGTAVGTFLVADLRPGPQGSNPDELTDLGGHLFFQADNGASGPSLWKSDGTAQSTQLVRDPVPSSATHPGPSLLRTVGKNLFFAAPGPRGGAIQLWRSDGTARGTTTLTSLTVGLRGNNTILDVTVLGNRLLFAAVTAAGEELWASDGTPKGTRALTAFTNPRAISLNALRVFLPRTAVGNRLMFRADDGSHGIELWTTDGTPKGTRLLKDVCPGTCNGAGVTGVAAGGRWYFAANDGSRGFEPWVTDGTEGGTRILRDVCRGTCSSSPFGFFALGERVFFLARSDSNLPELNQLWRSDGTLRSTVRLTSFVTGGELPFLDPFVRNSVGNALVFAAADLRHGREIWRSDGTAQGTRLLKDVNRGDEGGSFPRELMTAGGRLYFLAYIQDQPSGLWKSDGTEAGTLFVDDLEEAGLLVSQVYSSAEAAGRLIFSAPSSNTPSTLLWTSDGTPEGTRTLLPDGVQPRSSLSAAGGKVFFVGGDPVHGEELWVTDGTPAGTRLVADLTEGESSPRIEGLTAFNGRLYFSADAEFQGRTLWTSDGTAAGTTPVVAPGAFSLDSPVLTEHAGRLWFIAYDDTRGSALWSSDGTTAGTAPAVDFSADSKTFSATHLVSAGSRLFFAGEFIGGEHGLWATDGTEAGTRRVNPSPFTLGQRVFGFNGSVYFNLAGSQNLWKSDGGDGGPDILRDREGQPIVLLPSFAFDSSIVSLAGRFYFVDQAGSLIESDGTDGGTSAILENVGPDLLVVGNRLFFRHRDRETGHELWVLE
ncbi:MAG TPA: ELWxxDGT repeat protein [Thermoanaerobaculia bacterium]